MALGVACQMSSVQFLGFILGAFDHVNPVKTLEIQGFDETDLSNFVFDHLATHCFLHCLGAVH